MLLRDVVFTGLMLVLFGTVAAAAQRPHGSLTGFVRDETEAALPGVTVELRQQDHLVASAVTTATGAFRMEGVAPGTYDLRFELVNFAPLTRRSIQVGDSAVSVDATLHLALNADVTVTGKRSFVNLADAANPAEDLVGIAQTASQGAITARQLDARPMMRVGEVLEAVPGVITSQHSGEGKANQYYLRGFNLDHGTDFATTVAGMPVNMPTHAHGQGYSDLNFLMPELVSGVQFSKGPYFADQGDFATAGAANINYVTELERPLLRIDGGSQGYARVLAAASHRIGDGRLLVAVEAGHNDGPWVRPDAFRRIDGVLRYSRGDAVNGVSVTAMAYDARWNATDQIPERALVSGALGRFGGVDNTDGGTTDRYSISADWQRTRGDGVARATVYAIRYGLDLFSNFTYVLDDPIHGDQREQLDRRVVTGGRLSHRSLARWFGRPAQNTVGLQVRDDAIGTVGLYHTQARVRLETLAEDAANQASLGVYAQNETEWTPWLRSLAGIRADGYRYRVSANDPVNSGTATAGIVSPKGGVTLGPWKSTEIYVDAGRGFHSNDARGTTITRDPTGAPASRVTPLVPAVGAEVGVRSVIVPHLQSTLTLWTLSLSSELVFEGDAGTTSAGRPSRRTGIEWANYYSARPWLVFDADVSWSRARFTDADPVGSWIPGSVQTVVSAGATVEEWRRVSGSLRLRYFGSRPLNEDDSVRSRPTALANLDAAVRLMPRLRLTTQVFNLFNAADSDIDYFYTSRLPGEPPAGVSDVHLHPVLPRTARVSLTFTF